MLASGATTRHWCCVWSLLHACAGGAAWDNHIWHDSAEDAEWLADAEEVDEGAPHPVGDATAAAAAFTDACNCYAGLLQDQQPADSLAALMGVSAQPWVAMAAV